MALHCEWQYNKSVAWYQVSWKSYHLKVKNPVISVTLRIPKAFVKSKRDVLIGPESNIRSTAGLENKGTVLLVWRTSFLN